MTTTDTQQTHNRRALLYRPPLREWPNNVMVHLQLDILSLTLMFNVHIFVTHAWCTMHYAGYENVLSPGFSEVRSLFSGWSCLGPFCVIQSRSRSGAVRASLPPSAKPSPFQNRRTWLPPWAPSPGPPSLPPLNRSLCPPFLNSADL